MPVAVLDFGTNTFNLLIAEEENHTFRVLYNGKQGVKLGKGGINKGTISPEAMERGFHAISEHLKTIKKYGVTEIHAYATSAMRNANNGKAFAASIKTQFGFDTHIIDGEEEASLIYEGIKTSVDFGKQTALILDIGGGSNEFIICNSEGIRWKHSFELGMARIIDRYRISDPITEEETGILEEYFNSELGLLMENVRKYNPTILLGASGTFDTLAEIAKQRFDIQVPKMASSMDIRMDHFDEIYTLLLNSTTDERLLIPGMEPVRVEMIVPASIFIKFVLKSCGITEMKQSAYALKEGVMSRLIKE